MVCWFVSFFVLFESPKNEKILFGLLNRYGFTENVIILSSYKYQERKRMDGIKNGNCAFLNKHPGMTQESR